MADNRVFGAITCPYCGCTHAVAKEMRSGVVVTCPNEADGGCNSQYFGRSRTARGVAARKVSKWNDPDLRKEILGTDKGAEKPAKKPAKGAPAEVAPEPEANPEPNNPPPKPKGMFGLTWE